MATHERRKYITKGATQVRANDASRESAPEKKRMFVVNQEAAARTGRVYYNVTQLGSVSPTRVFHSPITYPLEGEIRPGWTTVKPLLLTVERDEYGDVILSDDKFNVYGEGSTRASALADYIDSLIEYYDLVAERADADADTGRLFSTLGQYLRRTEA